MNTKKKILLLIISLYSFYCYSQNKDTTGKKKDEKYPINFFAAAGVSYITKTHYSVSVSPADNTIHFEETYPFLSRFSLGLVWSPLPNGFLTDNPIQGKSRFCKNIRKGFNAWMEHFAVALLINVSELTYSNNFDPASPIDVGFGIGYRKDNFLALATIEFTPMRTPRSYFIEQYKDKNLPLFLSGSPDPVKTINSSDDNLFVNKLYISFGIKIAYSFSFEK